MKKKAKFLSILAVAASVLLLTGCGNKPSTSKEDSKKTSIEASKKSVKEDKKADLKFLSSLNALADKSVTTELPLDNNDFTLFDVGENKKIKPGIYDLTVDKETVFIGRKSKTFKSTDKEFWALSSAEARVGSQTKMRLILDDGDTLAARPLKDKTKLKLTAVKDKLTKLKIANSGDLIVGRDLDAGKYEISSNTETEKKDAPENWEISIYNHKDKKSRHLTAKKAKKKIELHDGEVITIIHTRTAAKGKNDTDRLTLTPVD